MLHLHGKKRRSCMVIADFILKKMYEKQLQDFYPTIKDEVLQKFSDLIEEWDVTLEDIKTLCLMRLRAS